MSLFNTYPARALEVLGVAGSGKSTLIVQEALACIAVGDTLLVTFSRAGRDILTRYMTEAGVAVERHPRLHIKTIDSLAMSLLHRLGEARPVLSQEAVIELIMPQVVDQASAALRSSGATCPGLTAQDMQHVLIDLDHYRASGAAQAEDEDERLALCADKLTFGMHFAQAAFAQYEQLRHCWRPAPQLAPQALWEDEFAASRAPTDSVGFRRLSEAVYDLLEQLEDDDERLRRFGAPYRYVFIDEFHDTTPIQMRFLQHLAAQAVRIMAVGDRSQNIYAWRGSDPEAVFSSFQQAFQAHQVEWPKSWRFAPSVAQLASRISGRSVESSASHRTPIHYVQQPLATVISNAMTLPMRSDTAVICRDLADKVEAAWLLAPTARQERFGLDQDLTGCFAMQIAAFLHGVRFGQTPLSPAKWRQAVLAFYRLPQCNLDTAAQEEVASQPADGVRMYLQLHLTDNPHREAAFSRAMCQALQDWLQWETQQDLATALTLFQTASGFLAGDRQNRHDQVFSRHAIRSWRAMLVYLATQPHTLQEWPTLYKQLGQLPAKQPQVRLRTIEAAKGHAFEHVVVYGLTDGNFPAADENLQVEKNRFYVAVTRAKAQLTLQAHGNPSVFFTGYRRPA